MRSLFVFIFFIIIALSGGFAVSRYSPSSVLSGLAAAVIFIGAFVSKEFGLYTLIFSMLLSPEFIIGSTEGRALGRGVTLRMDDFLLAVIGISWFARNAIFKELGLFKKSPLNRPIFYYLLVCVVSTGIGILAGRVNAKVGFFFVLKYFEYVVVYFMMLNYADSSKQIKRFIVCLLLTCLIASLIGISEIPHGRVSAPFEGKDGEPNTFGGYLLFIGMVAAGLFSTSDQLKTQAVLGWLIAVILIPFLYTQSRSSYLAFVPAYLMLGFLTERKWIVISVMLVCLAVSPLFVPNAVKKRIMYTFTQPRESGQLMVGNVRIDTSTSERLMSWHQAAKDWSKHPLIGYGVTGYGFIDAQYPRILVETGILGLSAFGYLLFSIFRISFHILKELKTPLFIGLTRGFIAGYVGLLFHAIGANTFIIVRIMEPFWLVAAMIVVLPELERRNKLTELRIRSQTTA